MSTDIILTRFEPKLTAVTIIGPILALVNLALTIARVNSRSLIAWGVHFNFPRGGTGSALSNYGERL